MMNYDNYEINIIIYDSWYLYSIYLLVVQNFCLVSSDHPSLLNFILTTYSEHICNPSITILDSGAYKSLCMFFVETSLGKSTETYLFAEFCSRILENPLPVCCGICQETLVVFPVTVTLISFTGYCSPIITIHNYIEVYKKNQPHIYRNGSAAHRMTNLSY